MTENEDIDNGKAFDWGRASADYARYRDIYPEEFYQKLLNAGVCTKGQRVLDIGTGTGVLPRNLCRFGADFAGIDSSENQIAQAKKLVAESGMTIQFECIPAEEIDFAAETFDAVTACQCFTYFNHPVLARKLHRVLKQDGLFAVLYMAWLPFEDKIAGKSEELVLKYNPAWTGRGETRHPISVPEAYFDYFSLESQEVYDLNVPFTRESWHGRMRSCRGIGASLSDEEIGCFDAEHLNTLNEMVPREFTVLHYDALTVLKKK